MKNRSLLSAMAVSSVLAMASFGAAACGAKCKSKCGPSSSKSASKCGAKAKCSAKCGAKKKSTLLQEIDRYFQ